jgi:hypothetical protein
MSDNEPGGGIRSRTIGCVHPDDDTVIIVDHVYEPEGASACADCGEAAHDPGMVGMVVNSEDEDGHPNVVSVLLMDEDALVLANRLQRAASLVLESAEDNADIEREAARFASAKGSDGDG